MSLTFGAAGCLDVPSNTIEPRSSTAARSPRWLKVMRGTRRTSRRWLVGYVTKGGWMKRSSTTSEYVNRLARPSCSSTTTTLSTEARYATCWNAWESVTSGTTIPRGGSTSPAEYSWLGVMAVDEFSQNFLGPASCRYCPVLNPPGRQGTDNSDPLRGSRWQSHKAIRSLEEARGLSEPDSEAFRPAHFRHGV